MITQYDYAYLAGLVDGEAYAGYASTVEIRIKIDGSVLWVSVDGVCRLRICGLEPTDLTINDERNI